MFKAIIGLATTCLLFSFNVNAQVVNCSSAASDSDGDGWGWENGASCAVISQQDTGSASGFCSSASSDSDGDGWGWENGASCQVSSGSSGQTSSSSPGQNPNQNTNQNSVTPQSSLVAEFTGSLLGTEADTHSFTLTNDTSVSVTGLENYNFQMLLFDTNGNLIRQDIFWFGDQCLPAGNYTIQINQHSTISLDPQNYAIGIYDQNVLCVTPSSTVNLGIDAQYAEITSNGTVLINSYRESQGVTAYDRFGSRLWSIPEAQFLNAAESNTDGSIILTYSTNDAQERAAVVESNGNVRWTLNTNSYVYRISTNNNTAALSSDTVLTSVDLTNGSVNFRYENQNEYSTGAPRVLDDGTIIRTAFDQNGVVQILTFD